jgi:hypothetical protein
MKLKFQGPNGQTDIDLSLAQSPQGAGGALTTAGPGTAALQIISGWGHGSTAGLGGADWTAGCGVFRGEVYRMGPSFGQEANDTKACDEAGISRLCSPSNPRGVWQFPWRTTLAPGEVAEFILTLPVAGRLFAYEIDATRIPLEEEDPCPCPTGCGSDNGMLLVAGWASQQIQQAYPGLGRDTQVRVGAPSDPPVVTRYEVDQQAASACKYTGERLLNGQNFLPPWVPNVDLKNGNDELRWQVANANPTYTVRVDTTLHIMYGSFDLAQAIKDYCEGKSSCAC